MYEFLLGISDTVGIIGVSCILSAYFFLSTGRWESNSLPYQLVNFIGAWLLLFSLYFHWNLASVLIEVVWIMISIMGISRAVISMKNRAVKS